MDLLRHTQPHAVALRLAGGGGESVSPTAPRWGVWGVINTIRIALIKGYEEE